LDFLDKQILLELSQNCRISFTDLSVKYDCSVNTIKNRVKALEEEGIIQNFSVNLRSELFNASMAIMLIKNIHKLGKKRIKEVGNHRLVNSICFSLNSGFIIFDYSSNLELNELIEFIQQFNVEDFTVYPILPPYIKDSKKPLKTLDDLQNIDFLILYHLKYDGRMSLSRLSKKTGASVPTLRKRLEFLRINLMIDETILLNPGMTEEGLMVVFEIQLDKLTTKMKYEIENNLRMHFEYEFWVSWKVVDRPILLLAFNISNLSEIETVTEVISKEIITNLKDISAIIGGKIEYYPNYKDNFFNQKRKEKIFSEKLWKRNDN
jgi:DNA-binding Lrp family transcriptional regulator